MDFNGLLASSNKNGENLMKKLILFGVAALGLMTMAVPAVANEYGYNCDPAMDGRCHHHHRYWHERMMEQRANYMQEGQDLNSDTWMEGAARATLAPHNARGPANRPSTDTEVAYPVGWY